MLSALIGMTYVKLLWRLPFFLVASVTSELYEYIRFTLFSMYFVSKEKSGILYLRGTWAVIPI